MIEIELPQPFNAKLIFQYLKRSADEPTFSLDANGHLWKLFDYNNRLLLAEASFSENNLYINFPDIQPDTQEIEFISEYFREWFDLETPLLDFYSLTSNDPLLGPLTERFHGLRLIRVPDLFEALCWSIIGQQVNLAFAYQCKRRLVEKAGNHREYAGNTYYAFPSASSLLALSGDELKEIKFSSQKIKYMQIVAKATIEGKLHKLHFQNLSFEESFSILQALKGIGHWSANYVLMRCLGYRQALPLADAGLHNALKTLLKTPAKPTPAEIMKLAENWKGWEGWEAYATFYLWQLLLPASDS